MKNKMQGHKTGACYIFVATLMIGVASTVTTESQIYNIHASSTDGLEESERSTTLNPIATTESDFSPRQGVNGFKPSVDFARFAEERTSTSNKNSSKIKFPAGEEIRTKKHIRRDKLPPAVLKLYDSHRDQYNGSSTDRVEKEESLPKLPTIYYGDVPHTKQYALHDDPQINNIEEELKHIHPHHHENHNYGKLEGDKEEYPKYFLPKHLLAKGETLDKPLEYGHGHSLHHPEEHPQVNFGHSHAYHHGYGYPELHEPAHHHHHDHHDHHGHHHTHSHEHSAKYTDYKGPLEGAVGKALHLLIPSALFLGGVSALFPNRVHVPTSDNKYRQKRAISFQAGSADPADFEDIPAKYLKREHRSDDGGIELDLDLDERENPFLLPNIRPPLSSGGRLGQRNYDNPRLTPHQRFELSPPTTQRTPTGLRHRSHPSGPHHRRIPDQYDAFFFNNPGSYNFDIPPPTFSPDSEPSPIPPTFPTNRLHPTEEMISDEEIPPPQDNVMTTVKPKAKKNQNHNSDRGHFVPIPIEEPVLDVIPDTTTETDEDTSETTTTRTPKRKNRNKSNSSSNSGTKTSGSKSSSNRDTRKNDREISNSLNSLESIPSSNQISNNDNETIKKDVDLSPDGPVIGLLSSYAQHDKDSPACQKKALCQLAMKGATPVATKFESFLWNLANLVPDQFSQLYDLEEIFHSIRKKECDLFKCDVPNLDIQE